jgi:hypothetical protein
MFEKIFFLIEGEYTLENQNHIGYGIGCQMNGKEILFEDLSVNCQNVSDFVEKCNAAHLSPIHLRDAVDDFLMEY